MGSELRIDRAKLTHGALVRSQLIEVELAKARQKLDAEKMAALVKEHDELLVKAVVEIPDDWLPEGITIDTPGWVNHLPQDRYDELGEALSARPGKKGA